MELLHLHYFMAAARYKNFTKAAKSTYTSQSNVSKQTSALEEELGAVLFVRSQSGVELTSAGKYLSEGLDVLLPKLEHLLEKTAQVAEEEKKLTLRLGLCDAMDLERIVPDLVSFFNSKNSQISIDFAISPFSEIAEKLNVGLIDCAFIYNVFCPDIPEEERIPVKRGNPRLYYSEKHPLFKKEHLCVEDFREETFVGVMSEPGSIDQFEALPFTPKQVLKEPSINAALLYVIAGRECDKI